MKHYITGLLYIRSCTINCLSLVWRRTRSHTVIVYIAYMRTL